MYAIAHAHFNQMPQDTFSWHSISDDMQCDKEVDDDFLYSIWELCFP